MTNNTSEGPHLMIIDDDDRFRERLQKSFKRRGYEVYAFEDGSSAIDAAREESPEYALVDLRLKGEWGLHVVKSLREIDPETQIVVLTAYGSIATAIEAVKIGAKNYLQKPVSVDEMERALLESQSDQARDSSADESSLDQGLEALTSTPPETLSLAKVEWEYINRVLTECNGNIRQTAARLGMHRRTLQRKLAKYPNKH